MVIDQLLTLLDLRPVAQRVSHQLAPHRISLRNRLNCLRPLFQRNSVELGCKRGYRRTRYLLALLKCRGVCLLRLGGFRKLLLDRLPYLRNLHRLAGRRLKALDIGIRIIRLDVLFCLDGLGLLTFGLGFCRFSRRYLFFC